MQRTSKALDLILKNMGLQKELPDVDEEIQKGICIQRFIFQFLTIRQLNLQRGLWRQAASVLHQRTIIGPILGVLWMFNPKPGTEYFFPTYSAAVVLVVG